jgi:hypothetical protein
MGEPASPASRKPGFLGSKRVSGGTPKLADWSDYELSIAAADMNAWQKKWKKRDASAMKVKLVEVTMEQERVQQAVDTEDAETQEQFDKLQRSLEKLTAKRAFLESQVELAPARARASDDDDEQALNPYEAAIKARREKQQQVAQLTAEIAGLNALIDGDAPHQDTGTRPYLRAHHTHHTPHTTHHRPSLLLSLCTGNSAAPAMAAPRGDAPHLQARRAASNSRMCTIS